MIKILLALALFLLREGLSPSFVNVFPCPAHLLLQRHPQPNPLIPPLLLALAYQRILLRSEVTLSHITILYGPVFTTTVFWYYTQLLAYGLPICALVCPMLWHQLQQALHLSYTSKQVRETVQ